MSPGHAKRKPGIPAVRASLIRSIEGLMFERRGFSKRTIRAMVDCSVDAPERLLLMTEDQLRLIPGVGNASMAEIIAYRRRFLGD